MASDAENGVAHIRRGRTRDKYFPVRLQDGVRAPCETILERCCGLTGDTEAGVKVAVRGGDITCGSDKHRQEEKSRRRRPRRAPNHRVGKIAEHKFPRLFFHKILAVSKSAIIRGHASQLKLVKIKNRHPCGWRCDSAFAADIKREV